MALFGKEARFFRFMVFFPACYLQNEVGDPPFFYISDITNSSTFSGKILRKKSMLENFRANVLNDRIPFTLTFHPHNHAVKSIILKHFKLLQNNSDTGRIFSQPPLISFKRDKNIGNFLVRVSFQTSYQYPFVRNVEKISRPKRSITITDHFTCTSANASYCITLLHSLQKVIHRRNKETIRRPILRGPL